MAGLVPAIHAAPTQETFEFGVVGSAWMPGAKPPAVAPLTAETHALGLDLAERYKLSIDDAMIATAATLVGSARLWSQDMLDGMKIGDNLRVADPFK